MKALDIIRWFIGVPQGPRTVVIALLRGGIGNQLFIIAEMLEQQRRLGATPLFESEVGFRRDVYSRSCEMTAIYPEVQSLKRRSALSLIGRLPLVGVRLWFLSIRLMARFCREITISDDHKPATQGPTRAPEIAFLLGLYQSEWAIVRKRRWLRDDLFRRFQEIARSQPGGEASNAKVIAVHVRQLSIESGIVGLIAGPEEPWAYYEKAATELHTLGKDTKIVIHSPYQTRELVERMSEIFGTAVYHSAVTEPINVLSSMVFADILVAAESSLSWWAMHLRTHYGGRTISPSWAQMFANAPIAESEDGASIE
jgi:hypothetical protein